MNHIKTAMLLAALTAIFVALGALIGGTGGMLIAFIVALGMNFYTYWNSDKMVLRMYGARQVDERTAPDYYNLVRDLARRAELPMPTVYIMESAQPNAFATGRNPQNAAVCASTGLLQAMSREEIAGVMAHELAHIKNYDTLTMTIAAAIGGAVSMLAQYMQFGMMFGGGQSDREGGGGIMGVIGTLMAIIIAPLAAMLVQMAISRSREYVADRMGGEICGQPLWLASALGKIEGYVHRIPNEEAEAVPATASLFIINPLQGWGMDNLFSTHPNTANRIAALEQQARSMGGNGRSSTAPRYADAGGQDFGGDRGSDHGGPWSQPRQGAQQPRQRGGRGGHGGPWG